MTKSLYLSVLLIFATSLTSLRAADNDAKAQEIYAHRSNRGLVEMESKFAPKGQWLVGTTASYSTHVNDNYSLTLIEGINSDGYTVKVSPIVAYTFADNLAAGVRFEYGRSRLSIDSAALSFGDDESSFDMSLVDYYALQSNYTAMVILRQYIPLGEAKRFALFAEMRLEGGSSSAKYAFDQPVQGTFSKGYNVGAGVVPGIVAFATNNVAFEVTVGMMGVGYSYTELIHNQVYTGEVESSSYSFKLNLLSIGLGVAFYL